MSMRTLVSPSEKSGVLSLSSTPDRLYPGPWAPTLPGRAAPCSPCRWLPWAPEDGHLPSERSTVPISRGITSSGKTPLSPTMSEPRREQIQVSSLSPLSRAPQDSLSLLSRRQAAAGPRLRRACWEPPAPPRSSRARAAKNKSLWPAMPQPGQGHPGMPRAEKHKGLLRELPPLAAHLLSKRGILTLPPDKRPWHQLSRLPCPGPLMFPVMGAQSKGALLFHTKDHTFFPPEPAPDCVSACLPEAKFSLMMG